MAIGFIGIILSLILLIVLAYRGVPVIIAAPVCAVLALLLSGAPLLPSYTDVFMPAAGDFIADYFPMFLTGAVFGGLMSVTGYARSLAESITQWLGPKRAMLATVLTSAVLTYGGISVFVVAFVVFPLALELFRAADIPRRLIPATVALGILTFTMTALPGTPQVQNIIPGTTFGTGVYAAPGLGFVAAVIMFGLGMLWLEHRRRRLREAGEAFADATDMEKDKTKAMGAGLSGGAAQPGDDAASESEGVEGADSSPDAAGGTTTLRPRHGLIPAIPLLVVIVVNLVFSLWLLPALDWSFLAQEKYGGATLDSRSAIWSVLAALVAAILTVLALNLGHLRLLWREILEGTKNALFPVFSTASEVGYGAVIASLGAFGIIRDGVLNISANALVASAVSTSTIAGITGSASGGMTIALNAFGDHLKQMASEQGISLEAMHRITAIASGGFDSMPHNGAVITLLLVCGMTHRESYKDVAVITMAIPIVAAAVLIPLAMAAGSF